MTIPPLSVVADGPPPLEASSLETLLHPVPPELFRATYWQQHSLLITGWADRFRGLFNRESLRDVLASQQETGVLVRVSTDREGDSGGAGAHLRVDAVDVAEHLRAGASVCVDLVERADPAVANLAMRLKQELGHAGPVTVKCYLSPAGFGFNMHLDAHVVTTLQLEGEKRWRVSRTPGVPFPTDNAFLDAQGAIHYIGRPPSSLRAWETPAVNPDAFAEVLLRPGDVLCLPAGTWHEAKAVDGHSLALNFAFSPADPLSLLVAVATARLEELPTWRAGIPAARAESETELPDDVRTYLTDQVEELVAVLRSAVADPALVSHWVDAVRNSSAAYTLRHPAAPVAEAERTSVARTAETTGIGANRRLQCVLGVADAEAAAAWYQRVLGCQVVSTIPEFGWVEVSTPVPGATLGLTEVGADATGRGAVLDFGVDDVEHMRGVLADNDVTVNETVSEIVGVARFLHAHDLDGNRLMFFELNSNDQDQ